MSTVLITGANRGLGLEFTKQYAADGWKIIACCRAPAKSEALQSLAKAQTSIRIESLDVMDDNSVKALALKLKDTAIDVLINNAGIYSGAASGGVDANDNSQTFGTLNSSAWEKVLRINTIAPLMIAQAFVPHVAKSKLKTIISITSRMGSLAEMGSGSVAYRSSKAALNAAMLASAHALQAEGITIVNMHPGWVQTDMGGKGAPLKPEQSVSGMRHVIASLTIKNAGQFLAYDGKVIPW